ncbi:MAG TPA: DUF177 domain-containing protein [Desulfobacteria bacterium]|nr:DUF177 domain-containing protein [Desulfobacteria bacterium]
MFIDVSEIRKTPGQTFHYDFSENAGPFEVGNEELRFDKNVSVSVDVKNTGKVLDFNGSIEGDTVLTCSRCLESYPYHLKSTFEERFVHTSDIHDAQEEGQNTDEMQVFEGNRIELDDIISESVILNVPMKLICSEECKGLCPGCGINLNTNKCDCQTEEIDPRLGVLKKFFER